jgi:hypothetical protein
MRECGDLALLRKFICWVQRLADAGASDWCHSCNSWTLIIEFRVNNPTYCLSDQGDKNLYVH